MFHRKLTVLSVVLVLVGCGGGEFSTGAGLETGGGGPEGTGGAAGAVQADAGAAGAPQSTGGVTGVTGGQSGVTGGSGGAGGNPGGTAGTGTGGQQAGSGGGTGGTGTGGQQGGTGGARAGTDAGPDGCSAPTTSQLTTALAAALPDKAVWTSFESSASTATCVAYAACGPLGGSIPTPNCGTISIQWGSMSVVPSGDVYVSFTAQVNTPAKYGCSGAVTNSCSISASTTTGTLKVHADVTAPSPFPYWLWAIRVESLTTWDATSTCPNFDPTAATGSIDRAIAAAVPSTRVTAPLSCP